MYLELIILQFLKRTYEVNNKFGSVGNLSSQYPKYLFLNEQKRFYVVVLLCRFKISKTVLQGVSILRSANSHILTDMT